MHAETGQRNFLWILDRLFVSSRKITGSGELSAVKRVALALVPTALVFAFDMATETGILHHTTDGLYIAAATVSALYGGLACGLGAIGLTLLLNVFFYNNSRFVLAIGVYGFEQAIITNAIAGMLTWFAARVRRTQQALKILNAELEARVKSRTEALEESNLQLEAFCYTMAHDLRAPLRSMQGFSQLLIEENQSQLDDKGRDYAQRIAISSKQMGQLIQDLLAYTQLSKAEFPLVEISLQAIVERVLAIFSAELQSRNAIVVLESPLPSAVGHLATAEQVVLNLISNALKFVPADRQPRLRIRAETRAETVCLWIEDNGIGIAREHQKKIFGVFERLHGKETFAGTGIGLAMGKKGVERMGGKIGVESVLGQGSRFWIELPKAN